MKLNRISLFLGNFSKFLIIFIIFSEIFVLLLLPTFLKKQQLAPLKYEQQKTAFLIEKFQKEIKSRLNIDKTSIIYPLIIEINHRINKLSWILKNEQFNFSISYLKDIQKNISSYKNNFIKLDKILNIDLQDINKNKLIKSVL